MLRTLRTVCPNRRGGNFRVVNRVVSTDFEGQKPAFIGIINRNIELANNSDIMGEKQGLAHIGMSEKNNASRRSRTYDPLIKSQHTSLETKEVISGYQQNCQQIDSSTVSGLSERVKLIAKLFEDLTTEERSTLIQLLSKGTDNTSI